MMLPGLPFSGSSHAVSDASGLEPQAEPSGPTFLYLLVLAYLLFDYGRPQDSIVALRVVRPALIVTVMLAAAYLANRPRWIRGNPQQRAILVFLLVLCAHIPFAHNNRYAYNTAEGMSLILPFVFAIPVSVVSLRRLNRILAVCLIFMSYQAFYSLLHGGKGTGSEFIDENDLALFLNTFIPIAYFRFVTEAKGPSKVLYLAALLVGLAGVVASMSRGGFLGLVAVGLVVWLSSPRKVLSAAVLGCLAAAFFVVAGDSYWREIGTSTDTETGTGRERIESWKSGWRMFTAHPLGVGGSNFLVLFPEYQTEYFQRGMWGRAAHSLWVTLIAELGIPGTVVYLVLLRRNIRDCLRIRRVGRMHGGPDGRMLEGIGAAYLASIGGFLASGTFLSVLYYPHYWYLTGLVVATDRIAARLTSSAPCERT
jgi:putative inorganic carbon (hco3(-)) transporter